MGSAKSLPIKTLLVGRHRTGFIGGLTVLGHLLGHLESPYRVTTHIQRFLDSSFSTSLSSGSVTIVSAQWYSVLMRHSLCWRGWFDSKSRYWSVWVGLRYTLKMRKPSDFLTVSIFIAWRCESTSLSSVRCMALCGLLRWRKSYS